MNTVRGISVHNVYLNISDGHLITAFLRLRGSYRCFFIKVLLFKKYLS